MGKEQLMQLGIPKDAWFVCIHAREAVFLRLMKSYIVIAMPYSNLIPAIEEITRRGGWIVRLGDPTMVPLKTPSCD